MSDLLHFSPWSFNNLNSYNWTKDSLVNTQANLRDPLIEISKGGQIGANWEVREVKDTEIKGATNAALHLEPTAGFCPERREIRLWLVLSSGGISKEIQWAFLQKWAVQAVVGPSDLGRNEWRGVVTIVWQLAFHTEKQSHGAWSLIIFLSLSEVTSPHPPRQVSEHIISNPRTGTTETFTCLEGAFCN